MYVSIQQEIDFEVALWLRTELVSVIIMPNSQFLNDWTIEK